MHEPHCPCNNADERGCFLISAKTDRCVSCECRLEKKHDPLCGWGSDTHPECFPAEDCGNCQMIQRIRLSVLNEKYHDDQIALEQAYEAGYKDAMKDANMTFEEYKAMKADWDNLIETIISTNTSRRVIPPRVPKDQRAEVIQRAVDRMTEVWNEEWDEE